MSTAADAANPYVFKGTDFPLTDADGDVLAAVIIRTLPHVSGNTSTLRGTLSLNGTALTAVPENPITVAQLAAGALTYYPEPGQEPSDPDNPSFTGHYGIMRFSVQDDGSGETVSSNTVQINIRLVAPAQTAATGNPTTIPAITAESPAYMVGVRLTATTNRIVEPNGINRSTLMWEWQSSATSDGTFTAITGATAITFTPTQALVGQYLRFCVRFMDRHPTPASEGPLCSVPAQVMALVQTAATGNPTTTPAITAESPAYIVGVQLAATNIGIEEPNGIDRDTFMWEWQSSATAEGTFTAIASADDITFTPTQALAGQYLRFCVRFMDSHPTPASEGPLCSIPARVTNAGLRLRLRLFLEGPLR